MFPAKSCFREATVILTKIRTLMMLQNILAKNYLPDATFLTWHRQRAWYLLQCIRVRSPIRCKKNNQTPKLQVDHSMQMQD